LSRTNETGQAFLVLVAFTAFFLLGMLGLSTDYAQIWAHRQMAQGAADAACQAAAADVFLAAVDPAAQGTYGLDFSWVGTGFTCAAKPNSSPCKYSSLNGYSGSNVVVSFPSSVSGVSTLPPGFGVIAYPYVRVVVTDPIAMHFTKLVSPTTTFNVTAKADCGVNPVAVPIPLLVLHQTSASALSVAGTAIIKILRGPNRSVQVNSNSTTAVAVGTIDLSQAGPAATGADFAVFGGPNTKPAGVSLGSTGNWISPSTPSGDPWATISAPAVPATAGKATPVAFTVDGCPDPLGCVEFTGGNYTACATTVAPGGNGCLNSPDFNYSVWQPNPKSYAQGDLIQPTKAQNNAGLFVYQAQGAGLSGAATSNPWNQLIGGTQVNGAVTWKNIGPAPKNLTAIFTPGLYYVGSSGLNPISNTTLRMSTAAGDGTSGVTFYLSTSVGTVSVSSNTGKAPACTAAAVGSGTPNNCIVSYKPAGGALLGVTSRVLQCPSGSPNPAEVPSVMDGNILLGPCSGPFGSATNSDRGFLFFQNRATAANPSWGGGGQFLLSGFMYFHFGNGSVCGTSTTCLTMNGGSGAGAYTLGNVVVDKLSMTGNSTLNMILNPAVTFQTLRPQMLR
jgi:hypothetical protein